MDLENYKEVGVNLYFLESERMHFWEHVKNLGKIDSTELSSTQICHFSYGLLIPPWTSLIV